jgi:hypothetical protein
VYSSDKPEWKFLLIMSDSSCKAMGFEAIPLDGLVINKRNPKEYRYEQSNVMTNVGYTLRYTGFIPTRKKIR